MLRTLYGSISQNPSQESIGSRVETPKGYEGLLDLLIWLGFERCPALCPNPMPRERDVEEATEGEGQQRRSPSQVEAGWAGPLHNRLGRWDDPVAQARASHLR